MDDPVLEIKNWYLSKPLVTRSYIAVSTLLALLLTLNIISPYALYYTFTDGVIGLEIWRLITTVFFHGKLSFNFIFSMFFAYFALNNVETQLFDKKTYADFLWLLILLHSIGLFAASIFDLYFTADAFIFALMYIYCKRRPFETINLSLMFIPSGINLKSGYFPWVYMGFNVLLGESFVVYLVGLLSGHVYIFIKDIMFLKTHIDYLPTPKWFKKMIDS